MLEWSASLGGYGETSGEGLCSSPYGLPVFLPCSSGMPSPGVLLNCPGFLRHKSPSGGDVSGSDLEPLPPNRFVRIPPEYEKYHNK